MGAQRKALNNIGARYSVSGLAEWYVPAIVSYEAIHGDLKIDRRTSYSKMVNYLESLTLSMDSKSPVKKGYWKRVHLNKLRIYYSAVKKSNEAGNIFDVRTLHERGLKDIDMLTYSFPCQDLSQQGKQQGISKSKATRSGLLWEIERALDVSKKSHLPKILVMENVTALLNKNNIKEFNMWLRKLESLGYKNDYGILNAADFGSPQARRRAFMISSLGKEIKLPVGNKKPGKISNILDKDFDHSNELVALTKMDLTEFKLTKSNINKARLPIEYTTFNSEAYVYDPKYTGPTLTASGANSRIKIKYQNKIRKLSSKEAYKYMGFTSKDHSKVEKLNILNENKMIFTCGNSISVEVLMEIFKGALND